MNSETIDITLTITIIVSGIIGYFISIALVSTSFYKSRANNYLSLSLFLLTSLTFLACFDTEDTILEFFDNSALEYLIPVTLLTYFLIQIKHEYLKKNWYKWLYLPFIIAFLIEIILGLYDLGFNTTVFHILDNASFLYNVLLVVWGRKLIQNSYSISQDKKHWLLRFNLFIIGILIIWFLSNIEFYIFDSEYAITFLWIGLSFLSWWVLYYGVFKLQLIVQKDEIHEYLNSKKVNGAPTKRKIDKHKVSKIITKLFELMDAEEVYKDPLLSRQDLARRLGTNEGYLSQIINQELQKSVVQFVNEYRIEAAKTLLQNPIFNKYSIEAIGMEVGFKSKSAFYKTFNASLGMSPGQFRNLQIRS